MVNSNNPKLQTNIRMIHRYLGFFLAGIMAVYALSGVVLIFRKADFLKNEFHVIKTIDPKLSDQALGELLKIKELRFEPSENAVKTFKQGTYNFETGEVNYKDKKYPFIIEKLIHLHKATTNDPLYYLNIFFGISLLFFVISAFFMYLPGSPTLKKGLYFTLGGIILTILMLII